MQAAKERSAAFIIGFSDGLVLPITVITTVTALTDSSISLLRFCLPFIIIFAIVMGLSNYYTRKSHTDTAIKTGTFQNIGLSSDLEEQLLKDHEQEKREWEEVLREHEVTTNNNSRLSWVIIAAYILSGAALLFPFLFLEKATAYKISCLTCGILLAIFGYLKAGVTENHPVRVIGRSLIYAGALCGLAYAVTHIFTR